MSLPVQLVYAISRRGKIRVVVQISDEFKPGQAFLTFHFHESPTNELTNSAWDPVAKIPETKVCAIRLEAIV